MNSLEPFIRHELENQPGTAAAPQANSTRNAPPLGSMPLQPPAAPDMPGTQLPPPELPQPEKPGVPMTDGTPVACRQKNAAAFLAGDVQTSVRTTRRGCSAQSRSCTAATLPRTRTPPPFWSWWNGARTPLTAERNKNFLKYFSLPVEISPHFPYYGSIQT